MAEPSEEAEALVGAGPSGTRKVVLLGILGAFAAGTHFVFPQTGVWQYGKWLLLILVVAIVWSLIQGSQTIHIAKAINAGNLDEADDRISKGLFWNLGTKALLRATVLYYRGRFQDALTLARGFPPNANIRLRLMYASLCLSCLFALEKCIEAKRLLREYSELFETARVPHAAFARADFEAASLICDGRYDEAQGALDALDPTGLGDVVRAWWLSRRAFVAHQLQDTQAFAELSEQALALAGQTFIAEDMRRLQTTEPTEPEP